MKARRPRLILADDHRLLVQGLKEMLGARYEIAGVAYDGEALLALLKTTPADCLLLDLSFPGRSGIEILPEVRRIQPDLKVLVLTMHVDRILAEASLASGALGFVPKDSGMEELETALTTVLAGRRFLSPRVPKTSHRMGLDAAHLSLSRLTPRQQEILRLLGEGRSSAEIGERFGLSTSAITWHRAHIRKALGLTSEWELARFAILVHLATGEEEAGGPPP